MYVAIPWLKFFDANSQAPIIQPVVASLFVVCECVGKILGERGAEGESEDVLVCVCVVEVCWKFFLFLRRGGPRARWRLREKKLECWFC